MADEYKKSTMFGEDAEMEPVDIGPAPHIVFSVIWQVIVHLFIVAACIKYLLS